MKITQILLTSTLLFGLAQVAHADHHGGEAGKHGCQKADTNNDGAISRDEFMAKHQARAEKMFSKLDANNDGKIDADERKAAHEGVGHRYSKEDKK
ncbi:EF-hand domain-containing protein [Methylotenera sp. L2L1]|uniref:EF-hand domain-containing protein n=1 Tax=Methylotenera sp. L2L1 TaxID=1502770 RepID=UPI000568EC3D|nr:EF-hand domain-containing protein [Methylotenera sp. L2L1]